MDSFQSEYAFPLFPLPPAPRKTPPSPPKPSPHSAPPPPPLPPHTAPPPQRPPHTAPPPPHKVPPPSPPHFAPPPLPPHNIPPPMPPHNIPPPPPPAPPGNHTAVIVVVFVSCGGVFFLAFIMAALWCFLKKKQKMVQKAENVRVDEHRKVMERMEQGPNGTETAVLSVEDDIHIQEDIRKTDIENFRKGLR